MRNVDHIQLDALEKEVLSTSFRLTLTRISVLVGMLFLAVVAGVSLGPVVIPFSDTVGMIAKAIGFPVNTEYTVQHWIIVTEVRLPRVIVGGLVGGALGVAGTAMQGLFRNPLVEPGYVGVSSGAALGAVCAIFFGWTAINSWLLPISAFVGAIIAMTTMLAVWRASRQRNVATLLLLGIGINAFFSALMNIMVATSKNEQELRSIVYWLQGGLEARTWDHVGLIAIPIVLGAIGLSLFGRELNVMLLGEDHAKSAGVNIRFMRNSVLALTALITGAAVAVSGIIGFVGLVVPHIIRIIAGPDHRFLLPASALGGAVFLILADIVSRMVMQPVTLQVGVICAIIGAPLFIFLIFRSNKGVRV
ncbi:iron ABC transporter permease [Sporosarcina oncorhynchi]|uniref:Iron ABC transporter permease n=1 Tax=Sporosarcina oncorhynchi TaxID=3056444 RepID=A0ABZ0L8F2_9BACL|nr:iron ABC transporter permease [Sporosarcina sp. T2O-4]WOV88228.1 iron ABC transporter permease [Sporosarcina sp. T2O-4]